MVSPLPSCPLALMPLQDASPVWSNAHENRSPTATRLLPTHIETDTGFAAALEPQQYVSPLSLMAHVCRTPADTEMMLW